MDPFSDVAQDVAFAVGDSGSCVGDPIIKQEVNNARRLLYKLGNWKGTTSDLIIQSYGGTVTLPASYSHITKAWWAVRKITIVNDWFVHVTDGMDEMCGGICKPIRMNEPVVTFRDFGMDYPECEARIEVQFESDRENDDLEIVLHGYSKMGLRVKLPRAYGGEGFTGITETPVIDQYVRSLYQVNKPATDGRIRVYAYLPDTDKRIMVGFYEAGDVNPTLTRYRFSRQVSAGAQYLVSAKKLYRPIVDDSDPVDIATDALIHALHALAARKSRNDSEFNTKMQLATAYLQRELGEGEVYEQSRIKTSGPGATNLIDYDYQ